MKIIDKGDGTTNLLAIQLGVFIFIFVIALTILLSILKKLKMPMNIARPLAVFIDLIIAYYYFKLVIS